MYTWHGERRQIKELETMGKGKRIERPASQSSLIAGQKRRSISGGSKRVMRNMTDCRAVCAPK